MREVPFVNVFEGFPKIPRLSRECIITEKIDGTNAQILITVTGGIHFGSRTRWVTPENDNYGFAKWGTEHKEELLTLGPGRHFGEWWGSGIQRNYGCTTEKFFSLFNVTRWCLHWDIPQRIPCADPRIEKFQEPLPVCCGLVPVLFRGPFTTEAVENALTALREGGSRAVPWQYNRPEGVVIYHVASGYLFKKTLEKDEQPKSKV